MKNSSLYIDCGSGVAVDMLLGALVDRGLSVPELNKVLHQAIPLKNWKVIVNRVERQGWPARSFLVEGDRYFGSGQKMKRTIRFSRLPDPVKRTAIEVFDR